MDSSAYAVPSNGETARWLRFVARWSLFYIAVVAALSALTFGGQGQSFADSLLGDQYARLLYAIRLPIMSRVFQTLEATGWLAFAGTLVGLAAALRPQAPIRATLALACAIAVPLTGPIARFTHRDVTGGLAARYLAGTPEQQAAVLQAYVALERQVQAMFEIGHLMAAAAFLLVGWAAFSRAGFPRWLATWLILDGIGIAAMFVSELVFDVSTPVLLLLVNNILVAGGLHIALAVRLWRYGTPEPAQRVELATAQV